MKKPNKPKGSTVILAAMYVLWIGYIAAQIACYSGNRTFLPSEVTYATAALFIVETVALARLKMANEGMVVPKKKGNQFLGKLGLAPEGEFEDMAQEIGEKNEKQTDQP